MVSNEKLRLLNAGEDELFIFASEIRNKLFPDTQIVGTRENQEILNEQFRLRLQSIDIMKTDLYKDLLRNKHQSVITESDCYLKIATGIQDAQNIFKVVEGGHVFQNNPDRSAAL